MTTIWKPWLAGAFGFFLGGFAISAWRYFEKRPFRFSDAPMSVLQTPADNPRGYLIAAVGMTVCGFLLWPTASFFHRRLRIISSGWSKLGVGVYRVGLVALVLLGVLEPDAYDWGHIYLAFFTYAALSVGLAVSLRVAGSRPGRRWLAALAGLHEVALAILGYLFVTPYPREGYSRWVSIAVLEWELAALIAISIWALAAVSSRSEPN